MHQQPASCRGSHWLPIRPFRPNLYMADNRDWLVKVTSTSELGTHLIFSPTAIFGVLGRVERLEDLSPESILPCTLQRSSCQYRIDLIQWPAVAEKKKPTFSCILAVVHFHSLWAFWHKMHSKVLRTTLVALLHSRSDRNNAMLLFVGTANVTLFQTRYCSSHILWNDQKTRSNSGSQIWYTRTNTDTLPFKGPIL